MTGTTSAPHDENVDWSWEGVEFSCPLTRQGTGPRALLLPALSSISTRGEMAPLQALLADRFETLAPDWPGFGTVDKPRLGWVPEAMAAWLDHLLTIVVPGPALIVAAGQAAEYVLRHFAAKPETAPQIVLVAPTWRGPLPTMMGKRPNWLGRVRKAVDMPVIGSALYAFNLNDLVIRKMARDHVYSDRAWLSPERMREKRLVARVAGARFGSIRFATGALDPFYVADDAHRAGAAIPPDRMQMIWGEEPPRKPKAKMAALAGLRVSRLPSRRAENSGCTKNSPARFATVSLQVTLLLITEDRPDDRHTRSRPCRRTAHRRARAVFRGPPARGGASHGTYGRDLRA